MVLCFASEPTNSTRSARMLSGLDGAIVLDVGGVSTFFRTPDVVAIALGGGTIVDQDNAIGPASVGYRISQMARVPGGDTLTLTDVAVDRGRMGFGDADRVADLAPSLSEHVEGWIEKQLADLVDRIAEEDRPFDAGAQVGWPGLRIGIMMWAAGSPMRMTATFVRPFGSKECVWQPVMRSPRRLTRNADDGYRSSDVVGQRCQAELSSDIFGSAHEKTVSLRRCSGKALYADADNEEAASSFPSAPTRTETVYALPFAVGAWTSVLHLPAVSHTTSGLRARSPWCSR